VLEPLLVAGAGFGLGLRHATDADHVVAVTTIVAQRPTLRRAATVGALWGLGHSLTLLVVGGALVLTRTELPPRVGLGLELAVAVMLLALGLRNVLGLHAPTPASTPAPAARPHAAVDRRPLLVGLVHGLAGSAAVALLAVNAIASPVAALGYLAVFGVGTVGGMVLVTVLLAAPAALAGPRVVRWQRAIRTAAGALSLAVGLLLVREIVVDGGLFTAAPRWSPR
jgi:high-affinity nickel-transport protein